MWLIYFFSILRDGKFIYLGLMMTSIEISYYFILVILKVKVMNYMCIHIYYCRLFLKHASLLNKKNIFKILEEIFKWFRKLYLEYFFEDISK